MNCDYTPFREIYKIVNTHFLPLFLPTYLLPRESIPRSSFHFACVRDSTCLETAINMFTRQKFNNINLYKVVAFLGLEKVEFQSFGFCCFCGVFIKVLTRLPRIKQQNLWIDEDFIHFAEINKNTNHRVITAGVYRSIRNK